MMTKNNDKTDGASPATTEALPITDAAVDAFLDGVPDIDPDRTARIRAIFTARLIQHAAMLALSYGAGNAIDKKEAALREIYALAELGSGPPLSPAEPADPPRTPKDS